MNSFTEYTYFVKCSGEANFLGGVASVMGVRGFDPEEAKKRFFEIYLDKVRYCNLALDKMFLLFAFVT